MSVTVQEQVLKVTILDDTAVALVTEEQTQVLEVGIEGPKGADAVVVGGGLVTEALGGTPDGVLTTFTITEEPALNSLIVYMNGLALTPDYDYTLSATTVSFDEPPLAGDILRASYVRGE